MKYIVYYRMRSGSNVNRDYPDYGAGIDPKQQWSLNNVGSGRIYLQHESHADYTSAFAQAGMVGKSEATQRAWLEQRVNFLNQQAQAAVAAAQANVIGANHVYGGQPGDMTVDQNGRRGRVPNIPLEVFRAKPISPDSAMDAVRDFCKGGGGSIPVSR